jgi:hypothetical protein
MRMISVLVTQGVTKDWSPSSSPSWLVLMRETWLVVEGDYDDVELVMEGLMMLKVLALLLKPLLQWRRGR